LKLTKIGSIWVTATNALEPLAAAPEPLPAEPELLPAALPPFEVLELVLAACAAALAGCTKFP
jgi:hypothetical protein